MSADVPARLAAAALAAILAGCQSLGIDPLSSSPRGASASLGDNLLGEPCRFVSAPDQAATAGGQAGYSVLCGKWEQPSARIVRVDSPAAAGDLAAEGAWRDRLGTFAVCQPAVETTILDGLPATALDCTLQRGGWAYQGLAVRIGQSTWLGESIPAALPVLERAIAALSGRSAQAKSAGSEQTSAEIARLETRLSGALYTVGDLQRYRDLLRLAQYYNYQGNYPEAEKRYREALALQRKVAGSDSGGEAFTLMHLALELSNQERFVEADAIFKQAEAKVAASLDASDDARLMSYRAIHLANQQKGRQAAEMARKATEARVVLVKEQGLDQALPPDSLIPNLTTGAGPRAQAQAQAKAALMVLTRAGTARGDVAQSKYVEAAMLVRDGRYADAERVLVDAVAILEADPKVPRRWMAQVQLLRAESAEKQGDLAGAERLLDSAIRTQRAVLPGARTEGSALIALGRVRTAQGRSAEALPPFRDGFAIIRQTGGDLRFEQAAPYFRAALAEAKRTPERREGLFAEMFVVAQMVRGGITAQTLALATARLAASDQQVGPIIRELQDARRDRDVAVERSTLAQGDPNTLPQQLDALDAEMKAIAARVAGLERDVQAAAPRYNQILDAPVDAAQVRSTLGPGEILVQVLIGPDGALGFALDGDGIEAYAINITDRSARQMVKQLRAPFDAGTFGDYDLEAAHDLFVLLFAPVRERLARADHLIFIPSGPLLSFPPALLVEDAPGGNTAARDYTQAAWLVRRHALTVSPSVQSFFNLRSTHVASRARKPFVGFGDFVPARDVDTVLAMRGLPAGCRADVQTVANAPALPNTAAELRAVAAALGTSERLVLGAAFSEEGVRTAGLDDYRVIYFATHGLLPYELNCWNEPSLITSKPPGEKSDGLLTAGEIIDLRLDADLVVLSACNTGGPGTGSSGESLSGLARAFFYAGARSMLVTHWPIPDEPTVRLMASTFRRLGSGSAVSPAEALRQSQLELIADPRSAHPLNWGAFALVNDGGSPGVAAAAGGAAAGGAG